MVELIPRHLFFSHPDRAFPLLSPDGSRVAFMAPHNNSLNVHIATIVDINNPRPLTHYQQHAIQQFKWACRENLLIVVQRGDDGRACLLTIDTVSGEVQDKTPGGYVDIRLQEVHPGYPDHVLIGIRDRDERWFDPAMLDLVTGDVRTIHENDRFSGFLSSDMTPCLAVTENPEGGNDYYFSGTGNEWERLFSVGSEDSETTEPLLYDKARQVLYLKDSRNRDTSALVAWHLQTDRMEVLAGPGKADIDEVLFDQQERQPVAVAVNYRRKSWQVLDTRYTDLFAELETIDGDFTIVNRSVDERCWLLGYVSDTVPTVFYHVDTATVTTKRLFSNSRSIESIPCNEMRSVEIPARDGLRLICYHTRPETEERQPPLVILLHGGPWTRDQWRFNPWHQWLANRGYQVLSVNFRGSSGFGKTFMNEGNREWGGAIPRDICDAVQWAVNAGHADPERIGLMGTSFGGYAALISACLLPERFKCVIDIFGPTDLLSLLRSIPPQWQSQWRMFRQRVGDPDSEEGRKLLAAHSPVNHVDRLSCALLMAHGDRDPRIKKALPDRYVELLRGKELPLTYASFPDEGHDIRNPINRNAFCAVAEIFLAKYLGGRAQAIGDALDGSSMRIEISTDNLEGL